VIPVILFLLEYIKYGIVVEEDACEERVEGDAVVLGMEGGGKEVESYEICGVSRRGGGTCCCLDLLDHG
jgi:hypothetical protein